MRIIQTVESIKSNLLYNTRRPEAVVSAYRNGNDGVYKLSAVRLYAYFNVCVGMSPNKAVLFFFKKHILLCIDKG